MSDQCLANAQYALGLCYYEGHGVSPDYKLAREFFTKAAEQGHAASQGALGNLHYHGHGVPKDYDLAAQWYARGADLYSLGDAQYNLGQEYEKGRNGAAPDSHRSIELYTKAVESKWIWRERAMYRLGLIYKEGREGIPQDYKLAAEWLKKASKGGSEAAQLDLFDMYTKGLGDLDYQRVVDCVTSADSQYKIGVIYKEGREGVPQNYKLAAEWLEKASERGSESAQLELFDMYANGLGDLDYQRVVNCVTRADPQYKISLMYKEGRRRSTKL